MLKKKNNNFPLIPVAPVINTGGNPYDFMELRKMIRKGNKYFIANPTKAIDIYDNALGTMQHAVKELEKHYLQLQECLKSCYEVFKGKLLPVSIIESMMAEVTTHHAIY